MATSDPNASAELQDYLRLEFTPELEEGVEEKLNFGWHRINVRRKKYNSYPFASYQYNSTSPSVNATAPPAAQATSSALAQPGVRTRVGMTEAEITATHDHSVYRLKENDRAQYGVTFDGGGSAIAAGQEFTMRVEHGVTFDSWYMMADQTGSIQIDVWVDTWANYPPTNVDTITGAGTPNIVADDNNSAVTLFGWSPTILDGDVMTFHVDSCSTIERCTLILVGTKT